MATNQFQFKVNQLAKDLSMKGKELTDILSAKGFEVKSQTNLAADEFGILIDSLTKANQIEHIDLYISGETQIESKKPTKAEPVKTEPVKASESKPADVKPAEKTGTEIKTPVQNKPAEIKSEVKPAEVKAEVKTAPADNAVKETPKQEPAKAEPAGKAPANQEKQPSAPQTKQPSASAAKAAQTTQTSQNAPRTQTYNNQRPNNGYNNNRPSYNNGSYQGTQSGYNNNRPSNNNGGTQGTQGSYNNNRQSSFNNGNYGQSRPVYNNNGGTQGGYGQNRGGYGGNRQNGGRPGSGGGFNRNGARQGEDYIPSAPKPKFQPQPIVRGQTPKGSVAKKPGATRVIDTHTTSVDLSKYDDKLNTFVPAAQQDMRADKQKLRKQNTRDPYQNRRASRDFVKPKYQPPVQKKPLEITIPDEITVGELASRLKVTAGEVIKKLMMNGVMATVNQTIDYDTAFLIADELGAVATKEVVVTIEEKLFDEEEDNEADLETRAPVVCVMGHVDHGKTSILDAIRHTSVTAGEAGGITQHIGAYRVNIDGKPITFLDTPGHEAFTAMRARGAMATDIAILVVAADDGIMPQTVEAINHAKAAGIEIIVAINKMDKPSANPEGIKQELTKYDLVPEEWGGDVMCVPVSAVTKMGIKDLLEDVLLIAEVKDLKANPNRRAKGVVIEAKLDKGRGPVATVLVQNGTLHSGDIVIAGTAVGRVRMMTDHNGKPLKDAAPSVPVELVGLSEVPTAGDEFQVVEDERMARTLADQRRNTAKEEMFKANARASLNALFAQIAEGVKSLNIIVKADVDGSVEAVKASLEKISNEEVKVCVIHAATGGITEGDVMLAAASNAIIVGFNVRPDKVALDSAERQGVEIRTYRVIYECIDEITAAMKGMLAPKYKETLLGHAEVRQTIHVPNVGTIAGSYVQDGKITRNSLIRVLRDGVVIFEDKISSLKRFKDDAREVAAGYECGVGLERFNDIKLGDILEAYIMEEIER